MNMQKSASKNAAVARATQEEEQEATQSTIWQDERFQPLLKDPRFRGLPKEVRKVKIDKRFQSMFSDEKFKVTYTVDKYGRRINKSNAEDLRKFYELESDASDSEDELAEAKERLKEEKALNREAIAESDDASNSEVAENDALISDGEEISKTLRERLSSSGVDYARGEGRLLTDSSSDDETSDEDDDLVANIDHVWGELDAHTEMTNDSTRRLAVCNMDWDRIRATDLMVMCSSFLPPGGSILSVKIYPSAYGKERLAIEEQQGPPELVGLAKKDNNKKQAKNNLSDSEEEEDFVQAQDSEAEEGDDYHMEKLRQYQLNRLRYYYAVIECDSIATADKIYKECDGTEYESSATRVDLRFIPDDTNFDDDEPTDVCKQLPDANTYKPRQFTTTALQQIKVDLTWDETAVERKELSDKLANGKLSEVNDKDLRNLVAYSSEDDTDDEEEEKQEPLAMKSMQNADKSIEQNDVGVKESKKDVINKYKALLAEINQKEQEQKQQKYEMEFTWEVNATKEEKNDQEPNKEEEISKNENKHLTPIEKVLKKRSEKNKKRKTERKRKALLAKGIDPDAHSANDSDESDDLPDGIDLNDPYFAEEFANNDFIQKPNNKKDNKKNKRQQLEEQEKEQEKQAQELALLLDDDDDIMNREKHHFSLEKIMKAEQETKSKRKRRKQLKKSKSAIAEQQQDIEDNFEVNVEDDRFKNIYTSHLYNIDPTDSHFKKTKGMEKLIQEKLKRRQIDDNKTKAQIETSTEAKRPKKQIENNLLVKSLKRKLQQQHMRQK